MPAFVDLLRPYLPGPDDKAALILPYLTHQRLAKQQHLTKAGEVCRTICFINRGACYKYRWVGKQQQVAEFYTAGTLVADFQSFFSQRPAEQFVVVQEDAELEVLSFQALETLYAQDRDLDRVGRILIQKALDNVINQLLAFQQDSPQVRYQRLVDQRPDVIQQFPQFLIASYLGITPVGLSKIRRRLTAGLAK